jgi:hypothetical protein
MERSFIPSVEKLHRRLKEGICNAEGYPKRQNTGPGHEMGAGHKAHFQN